MPFTDGRITSRQICVGAVTERTIAPSAVSGDKIADGAITINLFDNGVQPVQYVAVLPLDNSGGDLAFLTTNGKLYRWSGGAWTVAVDGTDIVAGSIVASDKIAANTITSGQIAANTITAGEIAAAAISTDELDANAVTAAKLAAMNIEVGKYIRSTTYVPGTSGWNIHADGTAEFQSATIRGTLNASDLTAGSINASTITITNINATNISTGTLNVARIGANTIDMSKIELTAALETNQEIRSSTYTAGSAGWRIQANGDAEFNNVTVRGTLATNSITGWLTTGTGGGFRTAASGNRIQIRQGAVDRVELYANTANDPAYLQITDESLSNPVVKLVASSAAGAAQIRMVGGVTALVNDGLTAGRVDVEVGSSGAMNVTVGSLLRLKVDTTGILVGTLGDQTNPAYSFTGDPNSGMYNLGADDIGIVAGGARRLRINATRVDCDNVSFLSLPVKATTGDPTGQQEGDMYVNTSDNTLRLYADAAWRTVTTW